MADITIKDLAAGTPSLTDLTIMANPTTGIAKKITFAQIGTVLQTAPIDTTGAQDGDFAKWGPDNNIIFETIIIPNIANVLPSFYPFLSATEANTFESNGLKQANNGGLILADNGNFVEIETSLLTLNSTTKGFLKPRMTTTQRNAIVTPATGLEVYDTTLNLPYYYNGTAWATAISGITTLNTLTALTQTFAVGSAGMDFTINSATSTHTFNIPTASATARGLLSSANWTTFNSKVGGSGTANNLAKFTASGTVGNSIITDDGTTLTLPAKTVINGSLTASAALARYVYLNPTLTAAANNDMLIGLDINPTYTNGAFTGIGNIGLRIGTGSPTTASKWGVYQTNSLENNYFAGKVLIGTDTLSTYQFFCNNIAAINSSLSIINYDDTLLPIEGGLKIYTNPSISTTYIQSGKRAVAGWALNIGGLPIIFTNSNLATEMGRFSSNNNLLINTTTDITSSKFTIASTSQGSLPLPRMTTAQIKAISSPVNGLMAYSTDEFTPCFYDSNAARWEKISHSIL